MKRSFSSLALATVLCLSTTAAFAQTRTSQLVVTNSTGTTKFSQTSGGMVIDNYVVLQRPGNALSTIKLVPPSSNGSLEFAFPSSSGTLLTCASNTYTGVQNFVNSAEQADELIATINLGTTTIDAARLNVAAGGLSSVIANANNTLTINTALGVVTAGLNLANDNNWTGTQIFPETAAQGNALINAINLGTVELTNYPTTSEMTSAIATAVAGAGGGASVTAGTVAVTKSAVNQKVADATVSDAAIDANSIIIVTALRDATSTEDAYIASVVSKTTGSMVIRAQRNGGGNLSAGEGCTLNYVIVNP